MYDYNENKLDVVFPPGDFLAEWLDDQNMTVKQFADLCGKTEKEIQDILDGGHVSSEMATTFEKATKMPAHLWIELQDMFDRYLIRIYREHLDQVGISSNRNRRKEKDQLQTAD